MHGMVFTKIFRRLILGLWGATLCSCTTYRTYRQRYFNLPVFISNKEKNWLC